MLYRIIAIGIIFSVCIAHAAPVVLQPGPDTSQDIWTTSTFAYAPGQTYPGGGLADYRLRVGGWGDSYYSLLQFNLAGMPQQATSVKLNLFCFSNNNGSPVQMNLFRNTSPWDWRTTGTGSDHERLWWADQPTVTPVSSSVIAPIAGNWYSVDVTSLYNDWQSGAVPNFGVELRPLAINNNWNEFCSSRYTDDATLRPNLVIDAIPEPTTSLVITCLIVGGLFRRRHK